MAADPLTAQFVVPEGADFHNGSSLPLEDDSGAYALVDRLRQALVADDAEEAAFAVDALRDRSEPSLLPFGPRTHVPALELAARLLVRDGSPALLEHVDRANRRRVERALAARDLPALLDLATRGVALPSSRDAALLAARLLFEQGRWWESAALAGRLGDDPAARQLADVARARAEHAAPPEPVLAPLDWEWQYLLMRRGDGDLSGGLPLALDGRDAELLLLDGLGIYGVNRELTGVSSFSREHDYEHVRQGDGTPGWLRKTLGDLWWTFPPSPEGRRSGPPRPIRHSAARRGDVIVIPVNTVDDLFDRAPEENRVARLVALDLQTGRPRWGATLGDLDGASTAFGPPTIAGDRVFVQHVRVGQPSLVSLVAFDVETGERLFVTPLVLGTQVERFSSRQADTNLWELDKRAFEGAPLERAGLVYACTGHGVVAAVDGLTGAIRHTFRYDRRFAHEPETYHAAFLFDTGGWDHEPVRAFGDRIVVAPSDSRYLYMLAAEPGPAGQLILDDPIERLDRRHVVELLPDPQGRPSPAVLFSRIRDDRAGLVLVGPDGHTLEAGTLLPRGERIDTSSPGRKAARPVRVGDRVLLPTTAGIRAFTLHDLGRPPLLLQRGLAGMPTIMSIEALDDGLVTLAPVRDADGEVVDMFVELWAARR